MSTVRCDVGRIFSTAPYFQSVSFRRGGVGCHEYCRRRPLLLRSFQQELLLLLRIYSMHSFSVNPRSSTWYQVGLLV